GKEAANEVGRPARGKRDHDAHGPGGEILGSGRGREHWGSEPRREKGGGGSSQPDHEAPLPFGPGQSSAFPIGAAGPTLRESSTTERRYPVSHCQSPRSPASVSWILASQGVTAA